MDERETSAGTDTSPPSDSPTGVLFDAPGQRSERPIRQLPFPVREPPTEADRQTAIRALGAAGVAVVLGIIGDGLLRATPWGLNAVLFTVLLSAAVLLPVRPGAVPIETRLFLGAAVFFAAGLAWRDARYLQAINGCGLLVSLGMAAGYASPPGIRRAGFLEIAGRTVEAVCLTFMGALLALTGHIRWDAVPRTSLTQRTWSVLRGVLIAVPILLVFGSLFMGADANFERAVHRLFDWDIESLISHAALTIVVAWLALGFLLLTTRHPVGRFEWKREEALPAGGHIEALTVLVLLDVLMGLFVATQVPHLLQGADGMSTVEFRAFARRGYFELLTATLLALPVLMVTHRYAGGDGQGRRIWRALAALMVTFLFVMLAAAAQRLLVMVLSTGVTELRLHSLVFLVWLAFVLAWFMPTVWRGRPQTFASGALAAGFAAVVALNAMNPDALMVTANAHSENVKNGFDAPYMAGLSDDAVPALMEALPVLPPDKRSFVLDRLHREAQDTAGTDWRTWNWGRARAKAAVRLAAP